MPKPMKQLKVDGQIFAPVDTYAREVAESLQHRIEPTETLTPAWTSGVCIHADTGRVGAAEVVDASSVCWASDFLSLDGVTSLLLSGYAAVGEPTPVSSAGLAFYDELKVFMTGMAYPADGAEIRLTPPTGAAYLRITAYSTSDQRPCVTCLATIDRAVQTARVAGEVHFTPLSCERDITMLDGSYIAADSGGTVAHADYAVSQPFSLYEGETLTVTGADPLGDTVARVSAWREDGTLAAVLNRATAEASTYRFTAKEDMHIRLCHPIASPSVVRITKPRAAGALGAAVHASVEEAIENLNIQTGSVDMLTPEMFGAVGDGSTDDTAALQAMIDAATDGKVFLFTSANGYRVGSTLTIWNKHHLTFAHANLIFGDSSTSRLEACIQICEGSSNISFENCSFIYGSQVIWLWACENIRVSRCAFDGCGYCVIQQLGYVSDHVFVTDNLAKNCVQDFVECNCEVDAPSKNWTVTGNIYVRDEKPVAPMKTECRFLGATAIRNVIISNNIIENVRGDSCISLEDPYGEIVIDGNTFTDCIGTGYIQIIHGDKNTIVSNNHFVNTMADNGTPFIYLYDSGSVSPYTKEFSVIVEGNLFNGNGTQANPLVNIDYTSYPFIIKSNVFRNIGVMFDHVGGQNISFDGNDVMCATFFLVDASKAGYTQNSTFSNNRIVGDITITNDYNGKVCSGLSFTGNYMDGTVSITNAKDVLFAGNTFTKASVFTFDENGYYSERMERYGNFQVGVGLLEPGVLDEDGIVQEPGDSTTAVMSQKAATDSFASKSDITDLQAALIGVSDLIGGDK